MSLIRFVLQPNKMIVFNETVARWVIPSVANYEKKTSLICDRANEDHCGSCGNGLLTNNPDVNYHIVNNKPGHISFRNNVFTEEEKYYFPFTL
jgi:hypothetical protein